jgi:anti-repressor protein
MSDLITIQNVRAFIDKDGIAQLHQEDVARGLGLVERKPDGIEYIRWGRLNSYLSEFGFATSGENEFIPENIFYRLAMKANNETAITFQEKIANDILPAIRKHGMYAKDELLDNPDLLIEVATKYKEERQKRLVAENQVKELTPAAEFGNAVSNNAGGILIRDYVKVLENDGIKIGQDKFFAWLYINNYIYRQKGYKAQWIPYKQYIEQGLFRIKETPVGSPQHGDWISITIRLSGKGQKYFYEKLKAA